MFEKLLIVFTAGGLGCVFRWSISYLLTSSAINFPLATLLVNVIASFILGLFYSNASSLLAFAIIAFCGGLSTFSSFSAESIMLLQQKQIGLFIFNAIANISLSLFAFAFGVYFQK